MAAHPLTTLAAASLVCAAGALALTGWDSAAAVAAATLGPLAAALATWVLVERTHRRAPAAVAGVLMKLFAAKIVLFAGYFVAMVPLLRDERTAFVGTFTAQYVLLHAIESLFLRRLFAGAADRPA